MKRLILLTVATMLLVVGVIDQSIGFYSKRASTQDKTSTVDALKVKVGNAIVLKGLEFKAGSAIISTTSELVLARALSTFLKNPTMEVEIRGYTDNTGEAKKNLRLSQNRADAVKMWLVKHGIPTARIKAKGYGSADPVATNASAEGRAQNRRIEFFRLK